MAFNPIVPSAGGPGLPASVLAGTGNPVRALADRTGAGLVVTGGIYAEGTSLRVQSQVIDAATGTLVASLAAETGPRDKPGELVDKVARRVMGAVAARLNKALSPFIAVEQPPSYDAYLEYTEALKTFGTNYEQSEQHLARALELDPTFLEAGTLLWALFSNVGRMDAADAVLKRLEEPATFSRATPRAQSYIRYARASTDGDLPQALAAARENFRISRSPGTLYTLGLIEDRLHHTRAAIDAWSQIRVSDLPAGSGAAAHWWLSYLASRHHELGEYAKALELAKLGQQNYPDTTAFYSAEVAALIALGRLGEIEDVLSRTEREAPLAEGLGPVLDVATDELHAHGHAQASIAMARRAAGWYKQRLDSGKPTPALLASYARLLLRAGECEEALRIRKELTRATPDNLGYRSSYAFALVTCGGSRAEALQIADALAKVERPFLRGAHQYHRARVLAVLGDREGAVRALEAAYAQGFGWSGPTMHRELAWESLRDYPPFMKLMEPKG